MEQNCPVNFTLAWCCYSEKRNYTNNAVPFKDVFFFLTDFLNGLNMI